MEEEISSIEKIKLKEQETEAKLKEKRELETAISNLKSSMLDATRQADKSEREIERLIKSTNSLRRQKSLEECRRDALATQMASMKEELKKIKAKSNEETRKVLEIRSSFCEAVHSLADTCDVWSLLMRPASAEPVQDSRMVHVKAQVPSTSESENRLKTAIERRVKALAERDRLAMEPDNGEEFVRINNALRYSLDKLAELMQSK